MNKTLRLILAGVLLLGALAANACWYATYSPAEYLTCRIPTTDSGNDESMADLWHRTLLPDVGTDEISKLIFSDGYTLEQIRNLEVSPTMKRRLTDNGNALLEYVCTMRQVNEQRAQMSDPWYYYYAGEPRSAKLNELADTCLKKLDTRYGDRYALLAARALNTLKRYPELDSLARNHVFKDKEMEAIFRPQYAGVLYNMGKYEEAAEIYAKAGDVPSLEWCLKKLGQFQNELSVISRLADCESNYNQVVNRLSSYIRRLEIERYNAADEYYPQDAIAGILTDMGNLIATAHAASAAPGVYQPLWRYAEALAYLIECNDFAKADSVLALIDTRKVDADFGKSIRTLRFITQSRLRQYNADYLSWLAAEAGWLIRQSDHERAKEREREWVCDDDSWVYYENEIMFCRNNHHSRLYFSDMLHKAADVIIVPRMLAHGDTVTALQLLDIVDYANLSDKEMRIIDCHGNASACLAMECGADVVIAALARARNPQNGIDRLWKETGSIRDADRWLDLAGTALLAEGRYKEAAQYLKTVSADYARSRNIQQTIHKTLDPFAVELRDNGQCREETVMMAAPGYYKLWFAMQMTQLEDTINNESLDDETRAQAKLRYGVGMANSVSPCWSLTRYGEGSTIFFPWTNQSDTGVAVSSCDLAHNFNSEIYGNETLEPDCFARHHRRLGRIRLAGERNIADALARIKDPEAIAAYLRSTAQYKKIKHQYANTAVGREMRAKCDTWDMY